jgi:hypothetical protein
LCCGWHCLQLGYAAWPSGSSPAVTSATGEGVSGSSSKRKPVYVPWLLALVVDIMRGVAARYRVVEATVFASQLGERRLAQPILCALEEANDLVFFGAAAAQEAVALQVHVAAEKHAERLRELFGFCELIQPFCG